MSAPDTMVEGGEGVGARADAPGSQATPSAADASSPVGADPSRDYRRAVGLAIAQALTPYMAQFRHASGAGTPAEWAAWLARRCVDHVLAIREAREAKAAHLSTPYTPGPWMVTDSKTVIGSLHLPSDIEELSCWYDWTQADGPDCHFIAETASDSPEGEANARLIAAAPDLYEALEEVVRKFDAAPDAVKSTPLGIMKARTALAKARGSQS